MSRTLAGTLLACTTLLGLPTGCQQPPRLDSADPPSPTTELVTEYWPNGVCRLRKEALHCPDGTVVDHGRYDCWYDNGQIEYTAVFVNGKVDGVALRHHRNGQKAVEQHFANGVRHGPRYAWDEQGVLRKEEHFVNDQPDGTWTTWDAKGKIKAQQRFERGVPQS